MEAQKIKEYNVSRMSIEKNVISWEGHAVRLPGVVRIWVGDRDREQGCHAGGPGHIHGHSS